ncbi:mCpol domain-containing protein [Psychrobium sp. 1_MG-2023]|uniref:mCpol domain-containing protein n=1 Tax=Psychrobium sp. 1_MG-2023 TaxID=3062624 RepID=UPI0027331662|nr:mCpol domain-containing protein [Psychrobium sp. 1_MG-2023]MDP2560763.1 mCpol domain-containing protein [Psychrobium sp. 1_MG-2023]
MKYISIDGDDIGRKITSCYLNNDENKLQLISHDLENVTLAIADYLIDNGFSIVFRAADGVVASTTNECNFSKIFSDISSLHSNGITFSAGVGESLREAYIALLNAKSSGKNCLSCFSALQ